jgi:hypothetical protein
MAEFHARTIIEDQRVENALAKLKRKHSRIEDVFDGLKWVLSRHPERGVKIPGHNPDVFLIKTLEYDISGVPTLVVLYRFDADTVTIEALSVG